MQAGFDDGQFAIQFDQDLAGQQLGLLRHFSFSSW